MEELNKGFVELIYAALDHGIDSVRESDAPLVPFVIVESVSGDRKLQRFAGDQLEQCVEQAMEFAKSADAMNRVLVAYDGVCTVDGAKTDAVMVVGRERGAVETVLFAQRYAPKKFLKKFQTIGTPAFLGPGPSV